MEGSDPGLGFGEPRFWSYTMSLLPNMSLRSSGLSHPGTFVFSQVQRTLRVYLYQGPGAGQLTHIKPSPCALELVKYSANTTCFPAPAATVSEKSEPRPYLACPSSFPESCPEVRVPSTRPLAFTVSWKRPAETSAMLRSAHQKLSGVPSTPTPFTKSH